MNEKWQRRFEAKLDALLKAQGIRASDIDWGPEGDAPAAPRKLTPAEQQAIDNAPKTPIGANPPAVNGPRTDANNAPVTPTPPVPTGQGASVETKQPSGGVPKKV